VNEDACNGNDDEGQRVDENRSGASDLIVNSGSRDGGGCEVGDRGLCNRLVDRNFVSCDASQSAFARFDNLEDSVFSQDVHVVVAILAEAKNDLKGSACFRRACSALHADLVHVPDVGSFSNFLALHKNAKIISEKISALQARVHRCAVHVTTDDASRIDESSVVSHCRTNVIRNLRLVSATNFVAFITRPTIVTTLSNNVDFFYHLNHCINKKSTSTHFGCGHIVAI
jgi:hypothetical protein